jgi:uncharacterized protein YbaP (TraB family)
LEKDYLIPVNSLDDITGLEKLSDRCLGTEFERLLFEAAISVEYNFAVQHLRLQRLPNAVRQLDSEEFLSVSKQILSLDTFSTLLGYCFAEERNLSWFKKLRSLDAGVSILIVGIFHLSYGQSLLELLRSDGYEVKRSFAP